MSTLMLSRHAEARTRQRGIRQADLELVIRCGTRLDDHCVLLTDKDVGREVMARKREIQALERLRGVKAVMAGERIVTAYKSTQKRRKADLRRAFRR